MAGSNFKVNRAGLREYLREGAYYPALREVAEQVESRAKSNAKVESPDSARARGRTPGKFRDSIHTERHDGPKRVVARVIADCEGAVPIENRDRPLGRAAG